MSFGAFQEAETLARVAWNLFESSEDPEERPGEKSAGVARALQVIINVRISEENVEEGFSLAREHLVRFQEEESIEAQASMNLAIASLLLEQERPKQAHMVATDALEMLGRSFSSKRYKRSFVKALQIAAKSGAELGRLPHTTKALELLEGARQLCQASQDVLEEACAPL